MSGRWFRPSFHVESFLRSIVQKSHINHRSDLSGDHFHEWAMISFKFSCGEVLEIKNTREPHHSQKWAIWRLFSWVGGDFVQYFMSRVSWDQKYRRAISFTEVSYLETIFMSGRLFRPNFHDESFLRCIVQNSHINHRSELSGDHFHEWAMISSKFSFREFLEIYGTKEPHQSQKWPIWRPFSWVGDDFVQIFMWRGSWDQKYKRATSFTEVSYLETIFMSGRCYRPNFHDESFLRCVVQKSHINHRSELSGDRFHEWAMISSKFSCREFLEIYGTKEPHQSPKWAIRRPFSWVGDDFVQYFMSRVSWDLKYKRATSFTEMSYLETIHMSGRWFRPNFHIESFLRSIVQKSHINHRSELSGDHFHEWAVISSKFSCRKFLEIYSTKEPHQSRKWAIWRPFSWVCDDFFQIFKSRDSWDLKYKRATSFTEVSYLETIFMSGRWFRPVFHVESFLRSKIQESHIIHRSELSGDNFHEWAIISSKFSWREFLEMYRTKQPHQSQKWAIWRPFSWVGDEFFQIFISRVSWDLWYKRATSITEVTYLETIFMSGRWFRSNFHVERFLRSKIQESHIIHRSELSGDYFHEWAMLSSKFSWREFLEMCSTKEPHQSQKWAIWRPFSWVGDDFVQILMSRVSWDLWYKRTTSITEVSYQETIFMSGGWFRPIFHVESFLRSKIQESHIIHRNELSGDHSYEWAMISSKFPYREFLEIYSTKEPHQSQKWAIWRPFSWVGGDFVQVFMSKVSWDL